jgi:hypothetical protein
LSITASQFVWEPENPDLLPSQRALASAADATFPLLAHFSKSASEQLPQYTLQYWDESASCSPQSPFSEHLLAASRSFIAPIGFVIPRVNPPKKPPEPPPELFMTNKTHEADEDNIIATSIGVKPFILCIILRKYNV